MPYENAYTEAQMLIRKPVTEVFNAMIDPKHTTKFWFTKSSGMLEQGQSVVWEWEMHQHSAVIEVTEIIPNQTIAFTWNEPKRNVLFTFESKSNHSTYVIARESGYVETGDDLLAVIRDSTGGFTTVLDGMKAYLEHGINLNLIADKFPQ